MSYKNTLITIAIVTILILVCVVLFMILNRKSTSKKENYPPVGTLSSFYVGENQHFSEQNITSITQFMNRYSPQIAPPLGNYTGKYCNKFAMLLLAIHSILYIKQYWWSYITFQNDLLWRIGPMEYLVSKEPKGFLNTKRVYIGTIIDDIINCQSPDFQGTSRCNNLRYSSSDLQYFQRLYSRISDTLNNNSITGNGILNFIFQEMRNGGYVQDIFEFRNGERLEIIKNKKITTRTSPDVYSSGILYQPVLFANPIQPPPVITLPLVTWVQNLGCCTDPTPIDYGQPIIRHIGVIYKLFNTYFICLRGIVYSEEQNVVVQALPKSLGNNYEVHSGLWTVYTNTPVIDQTRLRGPYNVLRGENIVERQEPAPNRNYYIEYEQKGSLQKQWKDFLSSIKSNKNARIIISGHSMGGGVAQMMLSDVLKNNLYDLSTFTCYLFNAPRCVNIDIMEGLTRAVSGRIYQTNNTCDTLTLLPLPHFEPEIVTKKIYEKVDGKLSELKLVSAEYGWTYTRANNIVGYNYDVKSIINNHFLEGTYIGMNRFFNMIYTPTMDITDDVILNGIFQELLDSNKIVNTLENKSACFKGTSDPYYWNRYSEKEAIKYTKNIGKTLFPDFYPEKFNMDNKLQFYGQFKAILYLMSDFYTYRATPELKNKLTSSHLSLIQFNQEMGQSNIQNFMSRDHQIWSVLWLFFNQIFIAYRENKKLTIDELDLLKDENNGIRLSDLLKYELGTSGSPFKRVTLKAVTRTLYLIICPPNLKFRDSKKWKEILLALIHLLVPIGIIDRNDRHGIVTSTNNTSFPEKLHIYYNSYRSRLGISHDKLSSSYRNDLTTRLTIGYDNFDWRIWEMLFGGVGTTDKTVNTVYRENPPGYKPMKSIMFLSDAHKTVMSTRFGAFKIGGTYNVVYDSCEKLANSCSRMPDIPNLLCKSEAQSLNIRDNIVRQIDSLPVPGYDNNIKGSRQNKCNSGDLLDRNGRDLTDCLNTYDPTLSQAFVSYFGGNTVLIDGDQIGDFNDSIPNNPASRETVKYKIIKVRVPSQQPKDIYMVSIDGRDVDKNNVRGRVIFDNIARDLVYAIKTQNFGEISTQVIRIYNDIIDAYTWGGSGLALGSSLALYLGAPILGTVGIAVAAIVGIILLVAESSADNDIERARKLLQILPHGIIKDIILSNSPVNITEKVDQLLGSSADIVNRIIDKYIDVLLGEDWSILDGSLPDFISFKQYFAPNSNTSIISRYLGRDVPDANIYYEPLSRYEIARQRIMTTLEREISKSNRDFHIFVTGYGVGGSIAQCMFLDSIVNKFRDIITPNLQNRLDTTKLAFYCYGSHPTFNLKILNIINDIPKPVLYNIVNDNDYMTSYPATYLYSLAADYSEEMRYTFTHYPSTMVFNIPIGMHSTRQADYYESFQTPSVREKYNYARIEHSPEIYMRGLLDLHNKIIGEWFVQRDTSVARDVCNNIEINKITLNFPTAPSKKKTPKQDQSKTKPKPKTNLLGLLNR